MADIRQQIEAVLLPVQHAPSLEETGQLDEPSTEATTDEQEKGDSQPEREVGNEESRRLRQKLLHSGSYLCVISVVK